MKGMVAAKRAALTLAGNYPTIDCKGVNLVAHTGLSLRLTVASSVGKHVSVDREQDRTGTHVSLPYVACQAL